VVEEVEEEDRVLRSHPASYACAARRCSRAISVSVRARRENSNTFHSECAIWSIKCEWLAVLHLVALAAFASCSRWCCCPRYSMGVSGLTSFVTAKIVPASLRVSATAVTTTRASPIRLLVDGSGLLHELYASGGLDAAHGEQYVQFERLIVDYVRRRRRAGIELEVALDGLRPASKHATCLQRREREQQRCAEQWRFLASAASATHSPFNNGLATLNQSSASTLPLFALVRCRRTSLHQMIAH